jgi:steroid delta-isomerase-like uncharacterized protein
VTELRKARPSDAPELSRLARSAYAVYQPRMRQPPAPVTADYAAAVRGGQVWVAEEDGRLVGLLVLAEASGGLLLENIAVHPDAQGRGVGARLLALAECEAARRSLAEIRLYTNEVMTENLPYYRRHGYEETGRGEQDGFRRVFFRKRLPVGIEVLVRRFYGDLWNRWDDTAVEQVLSEDFTFRGSMGTHTQGRDGWRGYRDAIRRGAPDFRNEITELITDGQRAAARLSYTGHHAGPLAGLAATGRRFEFTGAGFFTARDSRLASAWVLGDLDGLRRQLHPGDDPR